MAWATPVIHAVSDILTASDWNIGSNDLSFLGGATGAVIATQQTGTGVSYTDLATVGPAVTLTTGANAIVAITAEMQNSNAGGYTQMAYAVSGATTIAATDATGIDLLQQATIGVDSRSGVFIQTGLTAGSNTFTAKYKVSANTGTWQNRNITVIPLP